MPSDTMNELREKVANAIAANLAEQDGHTAAPLPADLSWSYIDQNTADFGKMADAAIAAAELTRLLDDNERLREAIKPFVDLKAQKGAWSIIENSVQGMEPVTVTVTKAQMLALTRTSPKGGGQPFIGRCFKCGMENLPATAVSQPCENVANLTKYEALLHVMDSPTGAET